METKDLRDLRKDMMGEGRGMFKGTSSSLRGRVAYALNRMIEEKEKKADETLRLVKGRKGNEMMQLPYGWKITETSVDGEVVEVERGGGFRVRILQSGIEPLDAGAILWVWEMKMFLEIIERNSEKSLLAARA